MLSFSKADFPIFFKVLEIVSCGDLHGLNESPPSRMNSSIDRASVQSSFIFQLDCWSKQQRRLLIKSGDADDCLREIPSKTRIRLQPLVSGRLVLEGLPSTTTTPP